MFLEENESADNQMIDICQLDDQQRIFLCDQAVKQDDLRQELDLQSPSGTTCVQGQFKCPWIVVRRKKYPELQYVHWDFYLQNSVQPNTVVLFRRNWDVQYRCDGCINIDTDYCPWALMRGIRRDFLKNLEYNYN